VARVSLWVVACGNIFAYRSTSALNRMELQEEINLVTGFKRLCTGAAVCIRVPSFLWCAVSNRYRRWYTLKKRSFLACGLVKQGKDASAAPQVVHWVFDYVYGYGIPGFMYTVLLICVLTRLTECASASSLLLNKLCPALHKIICGFRLISNKWW